MGGICIIIYQHRLHRSPMETCDRALPNPPFRRPVGRCRYAIICTLLGINMEVEFTTCLVCGFHGLPNSGPGHPCNHVVTVFCAWVLDPPGWVLSCYRQLPKLPPHGLWSPKSGPGIYTWSPPNSTIPGRFSAPFGAQRCCDTGRGLSSCS